MKIVIHCIPPKHTAQASNKILKTRDGRYFVGKKSSSLAKQTESDLIALLMPFRLEKPFDKPLEITVKWIYPFRKAEPKKNRYEGLPCTTKPDCDNICKLLFDTMTRLGYWIDDALIYHVDFTKCYSDNPRIEIEIK